MKRCIIWSLLRRLWLWNWNDIGIIRQNQSNMSRYLYRGPSEGALSMSPEHLPLMSMWRFSCSSWDSACGYSPTAGMFGLLVGSYQKYQGDVCRHSLQVMMIRVGEECPSFLIPLKAPRGLEPYLPNNNNMLI